jgi:hypothetical protein
MHWDAVSTSIVEIGRHGGGMSAGDKKLKIEHYAGIMVWYLANGIVLYLPYYAARRKKQKKSLEQMK